MSTSPKLAGSLNKYGFSQADNVWDTNGISPTIITGGHQIGHQINIMEEEDENYMPKPQSGRKATEFER